MIMGKKSFIFNDMVEFASKMLIFQLSANVGAVNRIYRINADKSSSLLRVIVFITIDMLKANQ